MSVWSNKSESLEKPRESPGTEVQLGDVLVAHWGERGEQVGWKKLSVRAFGSAFGGLVWVVWVERLCACRRCSAGWEVGNAPVGPKGRL